MDLKMASVVILAMLLASVVVINPDVERLKPAWLILELKDSKGAFIFIKALYPDGFHEVYSGKVRWETVMINLGEAEREWEGYYRETGYIVDPLIAVTLVRGGRASFHVISIGWEDLPARIRVVPEYREVRMERGLEEAGQYRVVLEETTVPVTVARVTVVGDSYGVMQVIETPVPMSFGVYLFDGTNWSLLGYDTVRGARGSLANPEFGSNSTVLIYRNVLYRYEGWRIATGNVSFNEGYVYVPGFERELHHDSVPLNKTLPLGFEWELEGRFVSSSVSDPYHVLVENVSQVGLELIPFLERLSERGILTKTAVDKAKRDNIVMAVKSSSEDSALFWFILTAYGDGHGEYSVFRAQPKGALPRDVEVLAICVAEEGSLPGCFH